LGLADAKDSTFLFFGGVLIMSLLHEASSSSSFPSQLPISKSWELEKCSSLVGSSDGTSSNGESLWWCWMAMMEFTFGIGKYIVQLIDLSFF
jgi:hypothetical protein